MNELNDRGRKSRIEGNKKKKQSFEDGKKERKGKTKRRDRTLLSIFPIPNSTMSSNGLKLRIKEGINNFKYDVCVEEKKQRQQQQVQVQQNSIPADLTRDKGKQSNSSSSNSYERMITEWEQEKGVKTKMSLETLKLHVRIEEGKTLRKNRGRGLKYRHSSTIQ